MKKFAKFRVELALLAISWKYGKPLQPNNNTTLQTYFENIQQRIGLKRIKFAVMGVGVVCVCVERRLQCEGAVIYVWDSKLQLTKNLFHLSFGASYKSLSPTNVQATLLCHGGAQEIRCQRPCFPQSVSTLETDVVNKMPECFSLPSSRRFLQAGFEPPALIIKDQCSPSNGAPPTGHKVCQEACFLGPTDSTLDLKLSHNNPFSVQCNACVSTYSWLKTSCLQFMGYRTLAAVTGRLSSNKPAADEL